MLWYNKFKLPNQPKQLQSQILLHKNSPLDAGLYYKDFVPSVEMREKKIKVNFAEAEAHEQKKGDQAIFHA